MRQPRESFAFFFFVVFYFFSAGRGVELGSHLSLVVSSPQLRGIRDGLVVLRAPAPTHCRPILSTQLFLTRTRKKSPRGAGCVS